MPDITDLRAGEEKLAELVRQVAGEDEGALGRLYDATQRMVFGLALGVLRDHGAAEEVTLDVYHQVWRRARSYDRGRGTAASWLMTLTRSRAIDRLRSRIRIRSEQEPLESAADLADTRPGPADEAAETERRGRIARAMAALPREQREAIETAYFGGLSHSEIAAAMGVPLGTVKTRIRLGMTRLRELLGTLEEGATG